MSTWVVLGVSQATGGKTAPSGVSAGTTSSPTGHVMVCVDTSVVTTMSNLRQHVMVLLKNFEGQLAP